MTTLARSVEPDPVASALRIAFVGPPGSGKGTQAALLAERHDLAHISTGELLRDIAAEKSEAGDWVRDVMAAGDLIPDSFVLDLVVAEIKRCVAAGRGFVLDGFPRTVSQYASLSHRFDGRPLDLVITFRVGREHLNERLAGRGRNDDVPETIARRLDSYRHDTLPMIRYMGAAAPVVAVDGEAPVDVVRAAVDLLVVRHATKPPTGPETAVAADEPTDDVAAIPAPRLSRKERARSLLLG